jgi:hypothetical protein
LHNIIESRSFDIILADFLICRYHPYNSDCIYKAGIVKLRSAGQMQTVVLFLYSLKAKNGFSSLKRKEEDEVIETYVI